MTSESSLIQFDLIDFFYGFLDEWIILTSDGVVSS